MAAKLHDKFPMLRIREEILALINDSPTLAFVYARWEGARQKEFVDFCSGARSRHIDRRFYDRRQ